MTDPTDGEQDAKHFSDRLIAIHDSTGPLTQDQRDLLMLIAGFVRGQGKRIRDLEAKGRRP